MKQFSWIADRIKHKLNHFSLTNIKTILKEHGVALVVIIVGWEIIEDIVFPAIFALLGNYIHPVFFVGIPAAWILCLHWLMVPVLWAAWIKLKGEETKLDHDCCHDDTTKE